MTSTYSKSFLDVDGQLDLLVERGLSIPDRGTAYRELQAIGYYRLSGYWYSFRRTSETNTDPRPNEFVEGTTLDEVLEIYRFDERLRVEILHAVSQIEVALRFRIGHLLGRRGPFAHNDPSSLDPAWRTVEDRTSNGPNCTPSCTWRTTAHDDWMRKQERNEEVSNEAFMAHFSSHYGKPLPIWTATEIMTFGDLSRLFNGMTQRDRQQIAADFDIYLEDGNGDAKALSNWLEHLRQTRNYCAHHARVWNRNHTAPLATPPTVSEMTHLQSVSSALSESTPISRPARRIYASIVLVSYFMARINYSNETRDRLRLIIDTFAMNQPARWRAMGFPDNWDSEKIWQPDYARDEQLATHAHMLRDVDLLYRADAAACLTHKEDHKARISKLNYYRKKGAALSVPGITAHRYPAFQFNSVTGDLHELAVTANRRLLSGSEGSEEQRWTALHWWTTPNSSVTDGVSPRKSLNDRTLTMQTLDALLEPRSDELD